MKPILSTIIAPICALAACLSLSACGGGGGSSPPPSGSQPPPVTNPPPVDPFAAVQAAIDDYPDTDITVIIGTGDGALYTYTKGTFGAQRQEAIASASKWLSAATIYRLVESGEMALSDRPQDYLTYWTSDPADPRSTITLEQLLSFTSGFNARPDGGGCTTDPTVTLRGCVFDIYEDGLDTLPGEAYSYGPEHLHIAAAMAEIATGERFVDIFREQLADPLGMSGSSTYAFPGPLNPLVSGGAVSTAEDYSLFLTELLAGRLFSDTDTFLRVRTANTPILFRPAAAGGDVDWRYALGAFVECDSAPFSQSCIDDATYSSPGSFGWTPWIDRRNGYWGLIARRGQRNSAPVSVGLEQILQPLILDALSE